MLTDRHLNQLRASYSTLKSCTIEGFDKLKATVGKLPASDIERIADARIPFASTAANSVLCDRKIRPESARWDHAVDVMTDSLMRTHAPALATA